MVLGGGGNNQTLFRRVSAAKLVAAEVSAGAQHDEGGVEGVARLRAGLSKPRRGQRRRLHATQPRELDPLPGELCGRSLGANRLASRVGDHDGPSAVISIWSIHLDERPK